MLKPLSYLYICLCSLLPLSLFAQPFDCGGDFYMVLANSGGNSQLYRVTINPLTAEVVFDPVSASGTGEQLNAIGYRQTDNYIYGLNPATYELNRISANGIATTLTTLFDLDFTAGYFAADITPDGQFMVLLSANGTTFRSKEIVFVDLSDPNYSVTSMPLTGPTEVLCTDIAFDPLSGILYGYDMITDRLITIDPATGAVDASTYPSSPVAEAMGAVFFDSFGRLYGYGDLAGESSARTLFQLNTATGEITDLAFGPQASEKDGCSCPYTIRLEKTVNPEVAFPCTEVEYSFQLANASASEQTGIVLYDEMPVPFTITEILYNPYGGTVVSGAGDNILWIEDMVVPPGVDSVVVRVEIGPSALGTYANQASLSGLPISLGEETFSDNPRTLQSMDSTLLDVVPLYVDLEKDTIPLCGDQGIVLDATTFGATYEWNDGSTGPTLEIDGPGWYWVIVSSPCEIATDSVWVFDLDLTVELGPDLDIVQGDAVVLEPEWSSPLDLTFSWLDPLGNSLSCIDCEIPTASPLEDVTYTLSVNNLQGCQASDDIAIRVTKVRGVFAPNVFSPDGDGNNDFFYLQGPRDFKINVLRIFNRWGALVFESQNTLLNQEGDGWDGRFKEQELNPDVFVWYAKVEYPDGEIEMLSGDVLILK